MNSSAHPSLKGYEPRLRNRNLPRTEENRHTGSVNTPATRQISSWREAEVNARDWMISWGFENSHLTGPGSDGGIDVRSTAAIAQVKFEAKQVGRPQLQQLVGARARNNNTQMLFFTGAGYSSHAIAYANEMDIALFHFKLDGSVSAINRAGREVARNSSPKNITHRRNPNSTDDASGAGCAIFIAIVCCIVVTVGVISGTIFDSIGNILLFSGAFITAILCLGAGLQITREFRRK